MNKATIWDRFSPHWHVSPTSFIAERIMWAMAGFVIALVAFIIWPPESTNNIGRCEQLNSEDTVVLVCKKQGK